MHTRSLCEQSTNNYSGSNRRSRVNSLGITSAANLNFNQQRSSSRPSSPLALFSLSPNQAVDNISAARRKSTCEPITEEPGPRPDLLHSEPYKRHHQKPRSALTRTQSAPQLFLSITTTRPIYINHSRRYILIFMDTLPSLPSTMSTDPNSDRSDMSTSASSLQAPSTFNTRVRGSSHVDFKTATTGISAKAMRNDLSHLVGTVDDPITKKVPGPPYYRFRCKLTIF